MQAAIAGKLLAKSVNLVVPKLIPAAENSLSFAIKSKQKPRKQTLKRYSDDESDDESLIRERNRRQRRWKRLSRSQHTLNFEQDSLEKNYKRFHKSEYDLRRPKKKLNSTPTSPTKKALRIAKTTAIVTGKIGFKIGKELWNNRGKAIEAVNYIKKQISKSSPEKRKLRSKPNCSMEGSQNGIRGNSKHFISSS